MQWIHWTHTHFIIEREQYVKDTLQKLSLVTTEAHAVRLEFKGFREKIAKLEGLQEKKRSECECEWGSESVCGCERGCNFVFARTHM